MPEGPWIERGVDVPAMLGLDPLAWTTATLEATRPRLRIEQLHLVFNGGGSFATHPQIFGLGGRFHPQHLEK